MPHEAKLLIIGSVALLLATGCERRIPEPTGTTQKATSGSTPAPTSTSTSTAPIERLQETDTSYRHTAPGRIVAIGDLHGDLNATLRALHTAKVIDDKGKWIGGATVVVQTGDVLDRGHDEREILDLFDRLREEARKEGGALHALLGNHEVMNVQGQFRYVTRGGFLTFEDVSTSQRKQVEQYPPHERGRAMAFAPGGPYAMRLARQDTAVMINDTLFVHGGLLPEHLRYGVGQTNQEVKAWMRGERTHLPKIMARDDAPTWVRQYSSDKPGAEDCRTLESALGLVGAKRMVVGHTPQKGGITSACEGRVWRVDVGLASYYGSNPVQVLQIEGGEVRVLREE